MQLQRVKEERMVNVVILSLLENYDNSATVFFGIQFSKRFHYERLRTTQNDAERLIHSSESSGHSECEEKAPLCYKTAF